MKKLHQSFYSTKHIGLTLMISGSTMLRLQMGDCGMSPLATLGSFIKATRAAGSWSRSLILTVQGNRFSRNPRKLMYS